MPLDRADAIEDVAARLALELIEARAGVELRLGEVAEIVFWIDSSIGEDALARTRAAVRALGKSGCPVDDSRVVMRAAIPESEWRDAWKRYFRTVRLTRQIVVVPSWDRHAAGPDDRVVHLDPGQAFGTGAHGSTQLCLLALQGLADQGFEPGTVIDFGTGSGILAIASALFWPDATITAIDNDPLAVQACGENAERNQLQTRIAASEALLDQHGDPFDLVLANIQREVLLEVADQLAGRVAAGGHLVLSGLLAEQVHEVAAAYLARGLADLVIATSEDGVWASAHLHRPS